MKLDEIKMILLGAPYVHAGEYTEHGNASGASLSSSTLARTYDFLGAIEADTDEIVELHKLKEIPKSSGQSRLKDVPTTSVVQWRE